MFKIVRTDSDNQDFRDLVVFLDQELHQRDGDDHAFYAQFNKIDKLQHVVVAYKNNLAVGCGAFKEYSTGIAEIKRMFVRTDFRGQGIAGFILADLELWLKELNYSNCILETGKKQPEAIALYKKMGFKEIPNYGQYQGIENSVCMSKYFIQ